MCFFFFLCPKIQIPFSLQIEEAHVEGCPKSEQLLLGQGDRFQKGQTLNVFCFEIVCSQKCC